jgi:V8-like Glu-specific endopeptidase
MLKAVWRDKKTRKPEYIDYGTAFAVAPRIIVTCTHNIYHEDGGTVADEIVFVPNHKGYISPSTPTFHSMKGEFYQFIRLKEGETLRELPTINELCLIALS